uniref:LOC100127341 protein, related n=1 Tax=Neospora caninum (strain Liverpool) TaxID=572307 RepID=A0A0F7U8A7_NEOCL|nr:TPA: LOC100127341 protein, related [Neospora caninum Liverpool]
MFCTTGTATLKRLQLPYWALPVGHRLHREAGSSLGAKLREALTNSGDSVVLVPGGIAEMYAINPSKECLHLNERKGLLKLALETGAEIVPIYCFGNTQTFKLAKGCRTLQPFARTSKQHKSNIWPQCSEFLIRTRVSTDGSINLWR